MRNHPDTDRHESRIRTEGRDALLRACCGPTNAPRCVFEEGLKQFISIVEDRMLTYEDATKELMKMLNSSQPEYSYIDKQFEVTTKIVGFINTSANHQTTIDDVSRWLLKEYNVSTTDGDKHKDTLRHLVFAVMGWSTMLYTPSFTEPAAGFSTTTGRRLSDTTTKQTLTHSSMRPLGAVLRSHGLMPIGCPPGFGSSSGLPTLLTVTHLNFLSLSRLGDVTISWVDDLSKHCTFDRYSTTKELRLFRLPSLCAKIYLSDINEVLIGRLHKCHSCSQNCRTGPETVAKAFLVEVLLSYRLLFGQHAGSRRLFREKERARLKQSSFNSQVDPLLDALCGEKDINNFGGIKSMLFERGVYNAETTFPHLGAQLMELEDYSNIQRPRTIYEAWNDERDPERLLTFKALIIIGAVSISLSILQVFIGVAQVALAT